MAQRKTAIKVEAARHAPRPRPRPARRKLHPASPRAAQRSRQAGDEEVTIDRRRGARRDREQRARPRMNRPSRRPGSSAARR